MKNDYSVGELFILKTPVFAYEYNEFIKYQNSWSSGMNLLEFPKTHYIQEENIILLLDIITLPSISNSLFKFLFFKKIYVTTINNINYEKY